MGHHIGDVMMVVRFSYDDNVCTFVEGNSAQPKHAAVPSEVESTDVMDDPMADEPELPEPEPEAKAAPTKAAPKAVAAKPAVKASGNVGLKLGGN